MLISSSVKGISVFNVNVTQAEFTVMESLHGPLYSENLRLIQLPIIAQKVTVR